MPPPPTIARLMTWITAGSALTAIVLGFIGFSRLELRQTDGFWAQSDLGRFFDHVYFSLSMLTLMARQTYGEPFLMIGRWFGVVFVFSAVLRALLPQIVDALNRWRIRTLNGHTVLFGLGSRGRTFLDDLGRNGPVVGVDRRPYEELELGDKTEALPIHVLQGDAKERTDLAAANLRRARRAIVCIGTDAENHAVAREIVAMLRRCGRHPSRAGQPLELIVPCRERGFGRDLIGELDGAPVAEVRPFNPHANAARTLLLRFPWLLAGERLFAAPRHWLFVGWDEYADALMVAALSLGAGQHDGPPAIEAFVAEPERIRDRLAARYPAARTQLQAVRFGQADPLGALSAADFDAVNRAAPVGAIFVFGADDAAAFSTARRMRRIAAAAGGANLPVFVRMDDASVFDTGLRPLARVRALSAVIEPFGGLAEVCSETALHDWQEMLARDVHEGYRQRDGGVAMDGPAKPQPRPSASAGTWSTVGEALRESNRRAVDHLPIKLAALGFVIRGELALPRFAVPLAAADEALVTRLEHRSWIAERCFEGRGRADVADLGPAGAVPAPAAGAAPGTRHYEPFRRLFDQPFIASDPWLRNWIGTRHHAGGGAWRERILTVAALPSLERIAAGRLDAALRAFLGESTLDERLGDPGEEFWTLASILRSTTDALLLRALLRVLGTRPDGRPRSRRFRIVLFRPTAESPEPLPLDALTALGAPPPIDYVLDMPLAPGDDPAGALLTRLAGQSDETLLFGCGPQADGDVPIRLPLSAGHGRAADRRRLPSLYGADAGRVVRMAASAT